MGGASVRLENVTVVYSQGTPNETVALDNVTLEIPAGETVLLMGGNGSGKSTLLKVIAGTIKPVSGKIFFDDVDVSGDSDICRAKRVSFVHQDPLLGTCPSLTFFENTHISSSDKWWWPFPYGLELQHEYVNMLHKMGIGHMDGRGSVPLNGFSGGQRQAVAISIALMKKPNLLLLDEMSSSLDLAVSEKLYFLLKENANIKEKTQIIVTHQREASEKIGDFIFSQDLGRIQVFKMS